MSGALCGNVAPGALGDGVITGCAVATPSCAGPSSGSASAVEEDEAAPHPYASGADPNEGGGGTSLSVLRDASTSAKDTLGGEAFGRAGDGGPWSGAAERSVGLEPVEGTFMPLPSNGEPRSFQISSLGLSIFFWKLFGPAFEGRGVSTKNQIPATPTGLRILVVDPDLAAAAAITAALRDVGQVVVVSTAALALEELDKKLHFDVIFCEVTLRYLTGAEFFRRARYAHPEAAVRVAFVSRASNAEGWATVRHLGRPCVSKPYDVRALRNVVKHLVTGLPAHLRRSCEELAEGRGGGEETDPGPVTVRTKPLKTNPTKGDTTMLPFGPFYPQPMLAAVARAERIYETVSSALADILTSPAWDPDAPTEAEVWIIGRTEEIEQFVRAEVLDWEAGRTRIETTASTIERYLDLIEQGLREHVRAGSAVFAAADTQVTRVPAPDTTTRPDPAPPVRIGDTPHSC